MSVLTNTVEVQGGAGLDSDAVVESAGTQTIGTAVSNITNYVAVLGGTGEGADAVISSTGNQSLFIAGTTTFTTAPFTDAALALNGGSDATDGGDALLRSDARQLIDVASGNMEVIGGTGVLAEAVVLAGGLDGGVNLEAQRILLDAGNLLVL